MQAEEDLSELIFQKSKQFSVFEGIPDKYFKQWRLIMKPGNYLLDTHERSAVSFILYNIVTIHTTFLIYSWYIFRIYMKKLLTQYS